MVNNQKGNYIFKIQPSHWCLNMTLKSKSILNKIENAMDVMSGGRFKTSGCEEMQRERQE